MGKKKKEKKINECRETTTQQHETAFRALRPARGFVEYLKIVPKTSRLRNCLEIDNWLR
jgi:hypothetical protein